jgi:hypothetical protein
LEESESLAKLLPVSNGEEVGWGLFVRVYRMEESAKQRLASLRYI